MSNSVYRRCGCRDEKGKQYTAKRRCPELVSTSKHGTWGFYLSHGTEPDPKNPGKTRRRQIRKMGFPNKKAAQAALATLRASLDAGTYTEPSKITLAEYAQQWLKRRQTTGKGLRETTASN